MPRHLHAVISAAVVAAAVSVSPAAADDWQNWDADGDGAISKEEFKSALNSSELFSRWDADDDTSLNADEYTSGMGDLSDSEDDIFSGVDTGDDDLFSETEFGEVLFAGFDADKNGKLDQDELSAFEG